MTADRLCEPVSDLTTIGRPSGANPGVATATGSESRVGGRARARLIALPVANLLCCAHVYLAGRHEANSRDRCATRDRPGGP